MLNLVKLVNDLNRLLAIYLISTPLSYYLGIDVSNYKIIRDDLLNDMLAVMFYHEVISYQGIQDWILSTIQSSGFLPSDMSKSNGPPKMVINLVKAISIIVFTSLLTGTFSYQVLIWTCIAIILYYLLLRPVIHRMKIFHELNLDAVEDMAETVIFVSLDNANPAEIIAKVCSLIVYHNVMKFGVEKND